MKKVSLLLLLYGKTLSYKNVPYVYPSLLNVTKCIEQCAERRRSIFFVMHALLVVLVLLLLSSRIQSCTPVQQISGGGRGVNNAFPVVLTPKT